MSNHPIAKSIVSSYDKEIDNSRITNFKESAGQGISVEIDHELYHLGNERYFTFRFRNCLWGSPLWKCRSGSFAAGCNKNTDTAGMASEDRICRWNPGNS